MTDPGVGSNDLPFDIENDTERRIVTDDEWRRGAAWGVPRPGHPEGAVVHHVAEVLANSIATARQMTSVSGCDSSR